MNWKNMLVFWIQVQSNWSSCIVIYQCTERSKFNFYEVCKTLFRSLSNFSKTNFLDET